MLNRDYYLPDTLKPEIWERRSIEKMAASKKYENTTGDARYDNPKDGQRISGYSTLIVGDSHVRFIPSNWKTDALWSEGRRTSYFLPLVEERLKQRHYDNVFLWTGSANVFFGDGMERITEEIEALTDLTNQYSNAIVISPMPFLTEDLDVATQGWMRHAEYWNVVEEVVSKLESKSIFPINLVSWREGFGKDILDGGGFHLNLERGYPELRKHLIRQTKIEL